MQLSGELLDKKGEDGRAADFDELGEYAFKVRAQLSPVCTQPLFGPLRLGAEALDCQPEPCRMVRHGKVNGLVHDQIPQDEVGREDQPPVEGEVSLCRTVAPFRSLAHHVDAARYALKPCGDWGQLLLDRCPSLPSKPVLEASGDGRTRRVSAPHDYLAIEERDGIATGTRPCGFHANLRWLPTKENLAGPSWLLSTHAAQPVRAAKLIEDPRTVPLQKLGHVLSRS